MSGLFNFNESDEILGLQLEPTEAETPAEPEQVHNESAEEHGVSIPGGLSETPTAKPYDASSISIPKGTEISQSEYNAAIQALQKSFKEGAEMLAALSEMTVTEETVDQRQQKYVEDALDEALLEAYENGPIFEAVKYSDKEDVKEIVKKLRKAFPKSFKKYDIKFKPAKTFLRLLLNQTATMNTITNPSDDNTADIVSWWTTRFWQVLGVCYCENNNIKDVIKQVNEEFADDLKGYKILYSLSFAGLSDLFATKFNWKNRKRVYFLIVDKKIPSELLKMEKELAEQVAGEGDTSDKKENE